MARKAKAWDSIKSPFIFNLSIRLKLILDGKFFFIFSTNVLFFLPPPHSNISLHLFSDFFTARYNPSDITPAVKSLRVAAPSSSDNPLAKETSKSLVSKDFFFYLLY